MAPDSSWMDRIRSALTATPKPSSANVGVLAFDAAAVMAKLLRIWRILSDPDVLHRPLSLPATRKLVSDEPSFLLFVARAELLESLRLAAASLHPLCLRCADPSLRIFRSLLDDFASSGYDPQRWSLQTKEMDAKARKMERYVSSTAALYKQMDELAEREQYLRKLLRYRAGENGKMTGAVSALRQRISWQREEVGRLKNGSLWRRSFDQVMSLLARAAFTVFARICQVFQAFQVAPPPHEAGKGFWETNSAVLLPPPGTLGGDALALRYANVVVVMERMVRSPRLIGSDARDDLYALLPASVRGRLRARLRGVAGCSATDERLAAEWRAALDSIVEWLTPAAHNTLRWQAERSFERRGGVGGGGSAERTSIVLTETFHLASRERTEEAVVEMLVGLNYVWRFEVEMGGRTANAGAVTLHEPDGDVTPPADLDYLSPSRLSFSERVVLGSPLHCH